MANDPDPETSVAVSTGEVRVEKTFEADRFPVPAIAFEIESLDDDPIRVRLVDDIPESFAMEGVGFHPDYEGDNWDAYGDHRVAYERTLDPGESVLTVYGIRIDDPEEATAFLDEPTVELVEADDGDDGEGDVLGRETTQVVRDALSGDSAEDLSELGEEPLLGESSDDPDATAEGSPEFGPVPREPEDGLTPALRDRDRDVTAVTVPRESADASEGPSTAGVGSVTGGDRPAAAGDESVASALAAEIREGTVDDDDMAELREAFEGSVPTSVDVRVGRLQSQIEDLLAYREALAAFLDENGTAADMSEAVDSLADRVDDLERTLEAAETDREDLHEEVTAATDAVADATERLDALATDLADLESTAERLDERLTEVEELEADVDEIQSELDDLRSFRDRLNTAFGSDDG